MNDFNSQELPSFLNSKLGYAVNGIIKRRLKSMNMREPEKISHGHPNLSQTIGKHKKEDTLVLVRMRKHYNRAVSQTEQYIKNIQQKLRSVKERRKKLSFVYENLKLEEPGETNHKDEYAYLLRKYEVVTQSRRSNASRLKNRFRELEKEFQNLQGASLRIKAQVLKKGQQSRLLKLQHQQKNHGYDNGAWTPDVDFIYKPSIKKIYHMSK